MSSENFTYVTGNYSAVREHFFPNDTVSMVTGTRSGSPDGYDAGGAIKFSIATIVFYSIFEVVCVLFYRIMKRNRHGLDMHQDKNIARCLKLERKLKMDGYKIRLMFEIRQWRRKYSRGKGKLPQTRTISNENYDTERSLEALEKRHQLHLCPSIEQNEFSDSSNLEIPDSDKSESYYKQVELGSAFKLSPKEDVEYSEHACSSQLNQHISSP